MPLGTLYTYIAIFYTTFIVNYAAILIFLCFQHVEMCCLSTCTDESNWISKLWFKCRM